MVTVNRLAMANPLATANQLAMGSRFLPLATSSSLLLGGIQDNSRDTHSSSQDTLLAVRGWEGLSVLAIYREGGNSTVNTGAEASPGPI